MARKKSNFTIQTETPIYEGEAVELDAKTKAEAAAALAQQLLLLELEQTQKLKNAIMKPKNKTIIIALLALAAFGAYWFYFRKK